MADPVYISSWFASSSFVDCSAETISDLISTMQLEAEAIAQDIRELEELRDRGWTMDGCDYVNGFCMTITTTNREAAEEYKLGADKLSDILGVDDEVEFVSPAGGKGKE